MQKLLSFRWKYWRLQHLERIQTTYLILCDFVQNLCSVLPQHLYNLKNVQHYLEGLLMFATQLNFFLKDKANLEFIILFTLYWQEISASSAHYLSHKKISQTKCYKQYDTSFQFSFHCSFRCCAPFCLLCCSLRPLLLIGGKLSTANQDPPKDWF